MNDVAVRQNGTEVFQPSDRISTPMEMLDHAVANNASIEILEKLMALQERWEANRGRLAFNEAIASAKAEIPVIDKNREVDFRSAKGRTHYRHEDLAEITRVVTPILGKHGLSYRFKTTQEAAAVTVTCVLSHREGYSEENSLSAGRDESGNKNSIQAIGSTITYLQRYTLKAALGLAASDDDDANTVIDAPFISEDQIIDLRDLAESVDADMPRFLQFLKVEQLSEITTDRLDFAVKALKNKAKKQ